MESKVTEMSAQDTLPDVVPPLKQHSDYYRDLPLNAPFNWLSAGMADLVIQPRLSLAYGFIVCAVSIIIVFGLVLTGYDHFLFPALSAFAVIAPLFAVGLYEKSRRLAEGRPVSLSDMIFAKSQSRGQLLFIGVLLSLLILGWIRTSVLIYALFFGVVPFPGSHEILPMLVFTPRGWAMLLVGTICGGLIAAFAFAISFLGVPLLLDKDVDALTAMGSSFATAWANKRVTIIWGAIVVAALLATFATAFLALIVVFPLLGHATWHAYKDFEDVL